MACVTYFLVRDRLQNNRKRGPTVVVEDVKNLEEVLAVKTEREAGRKTREAAKAGDGEKENSSNGKHAATRQRNRWRSRNHRCCTGAMTSRRSGKAERHADSPLHLVHHCLRAGGQNLRVKPLRSHGAQLLT